MKALTTKTAVLITSERKMHPMHFPVPAFIFCILSFVLTSYSSSMQQKGTKNDPDPDKRYELLEKLEKGASISSEEISSSMGNFSADHRKGEGYPKYDIPDFELPSLPPIPPFQGHYYYWQNDNNQFFISDEDVAEIHRHLNKSMDELKHDIESFRHSEEFRKFHEELQKWNENFRKDLDKMKEEWNEQRKEARSKDLYHEIM
jgi:hypothetical protein